MANHKSIKYLLVFIILGLVNCKDNQSSLMPTVVTESAQDITSYSARIGGKVTSDGDNQITDRGVYWGTQPGTDSTGTQLQMGEGMGTFDTVLTNLTAGIKYFVKAYAINGNGTAYGTETFFTTQIFLPVVSTLEASDVTPTSAKVGGNITDDGGNEITARGIYWGTQPNTITTGVKLSLESGSGEFTTTLTDLTRGITYYVMAYATNIKGTTYGEELNFSTSSELPELYTSSVTKIYTHAAFVGGTVASDGGNPVTERGVYFSASANAETTGTKISLGDGLGIFNDSVPNLNPGTSYYVKAFATNRVGTIYGEEKTFTTLGELPKATTLYAEELSTSGAKLFGIISANKLNTAVTFEYGTTTSYGNSAAISNGDITEDDDTVYTSITGLSPNTTYYFRVRAENELGVTYGGDSTFSTVLDGITGTVTDADGNTYGTIGIGHQTWMIENLKTTKFNDGSNIRFVANDSIWEQLSSDGYCWYNNDSTNKDTYGALYNWYTVNTGKLCPTGWHVPTESDYTELVDYLGGAGEAGGYLKATGTSLWNTPNTGASNQYGFSGLGAGLRDNYADFDFMKINGNWWSSTNYSTLTAGYFYLLYNYPNAFQNYINKKFGLSVRCVKNK